VVLMATSPVPGAGSMGRSAAEARDGCDNQDRIYRGGPLRPRRERPAIVMSELHYRFDGESVGGWASAELAGRMWSVLGGGPLLFDETREVSRIDESCTCGE
jgi:hypothetical protein